MVLAEAGGAPVSPVQLQKALFLIGENLHPDRFYHFKPYDYGPFSREVYSDAQELANMGLVSITDPLGGYKTYAATLAGLNHARERRAQLDASAQEYLSKVVTWVRSLSFKELVVAIYTAYPQMRENSVFRE